MSRTFAETTSVGSISSLKSTTMFEPMATSAAPIAGVEATTPGAVSSTTKVQLRGAASGLPTRSRALSMVAV